MLTATTAWGRVTHIPYPISICIKLLGVAVVRAVVTHVAYSITVGILLILVARPNPRTGCGTIIIAFTDHSRASGPGAATA